MSAGRGRVGRGEGPKVIRITVPMGGAGTHVNVYVVFVDGEAVLVDAGPPGSGPSIEAALAEHGVPPPRVIVLTHAHSDHFGGAAYLAERWRARVYLESRARDVLAAQRREGWRETLEEWYVKLGAPREEARALAGTHPTATALPEMEDPPEVLGSGPEAWVLIPTPGHAVGHVSLYSRFTQSMIGGDVILPGETPNVSLLPNGEEDALGTYVKTLVRLRVLGIRQLYPGHGETTTAIAELCDAMFAHHKVRQRHVVSALASGARSIYEVALAIPWSGGRRRFVDLGLVDRRLALGEAAAHVRHLERRGGIERRGNTWLLDRKQFERRGSGGCGELV